VYPIENEQALIRLSNIKEAVPAPTDAAAEGQDPTEVDQFNPEKMSNKVPIIKTKISEPEQ
jgi:hypothetical protein